MVRKRKLKKEKKYLEPEDNVKSGFSKIYTKPDMDNPTNIPYSLILTDAFFIRLNLFN